MFIYQTLCNILTETINVESLQVTSLCGSVMDTLYLDGTEGENYNNSKQPCYNIYSQQWIDIGKTFDGGYVYT